jgi:hypothetical protein
MSICRSRCPWSIKPSSDRRAWRWGGKLFVCFAGLPAAGLSPVPSRSMPALRRPGQSRAVLDFEQDHRGDHQGFRLQAGPGFLGNRRKSTHFPGVDLRSSRRVDEWSTSREGRHMGSAAEVKPCRTLHARSYVPKAGCIASAKRQTRFKRTIYGYTADIPIPTEDLRHGHQEFGSWYPGLVLSVVLIGRSN